VLLGYTLVLPPIAYPVVSGVKYATRVAPLDPVTEADVPSGTGEGDVLILVMCGGNAPSIPVQSWNLSADWTLARRSATPNTGFPVFIYYVPYSPELFPFTLIPKSSGGTPIASTNAFYGALMTYTEGHEYGGSGSYGAFNADSYIWGSPPADASAPPAFAEGTAIGAAVSDGIVTNLTLAIPGGFTERVAIKQSGTQFNSTLRAKPDGTNIWVNSTFGFFAVDQTSLEFTYATPTLEPTSGNAVQSVGNAGFDVDTGANRFYRCRPAQTISFYGPLPAVVEVWNTTASPATQVATIAHTRTPNDVIVVPPVDGFPKSLIVSYDGYTDGTRFGNTVRRYDASTFAVLDEWTPAGTTYSGSSTTDVSIKQMFVRDLGGTRFLFVVNNYAVYKINMVTHAVTATCSSGSISNLFMDAAIGHDSIWLGVYNTGNVRRYSLSTLALQAAITLSQPSGPITTNDTAVYTGNLAGTHKVVKIDPSTNAVTVSVSGENFTRWITSTNTQVFRARDQILRAFDPATLATIGNGLGIGQYDIKTPLSIIDRQFVTNSYAPEGAPRWTKSPGGTYGAAAFVSMNGVALEQGGWSLGMIGV
jgi:hypothetical protein